jgi:hypothetical protein
MKILIIIIKIFLIYVHSNTFIFFIENVDEYNILISINLLDNFLKVISFYSYVFDLFNLFQAFF